MIWLASFPRSGNTYTRNILKEVFSLDSSYDDEEGWQNFPIVKTHHLPYHIRDLKDSDIVIYLVRDGRDSTVSLAHHMRDIAKTNDVLLHNMSESIIAAENSYFGGWSNHAYHWIKRADVVIRYEDLIDDPKGTFKAIQDKLGLPQGKWEKLPSFEKLKASKTPYGIVKTEWEEDKEIAQKFYRKGKAGSWKEEMPSDIQSLFWSFHGDFMTKLGYGKTGDIAGRETFYQQLDAIRSDFTEPSKRIKVLIEAQKLKDIYHDGVFRYVHSLVKYMLWLKKNRGEAQDLDIHLLINGQVKPLYSKLEAFDVIDNPVVKTFKSRLWSLYNYFPRPFQKFSVRFVNAYFSLKSQFYLWKNRKQFEAFDLLHVSLPQNYYAFKYVKNTPVLCTVHDMTHAIYPEHHLKRNIRNAEKGMDFLTGRNAFWKAVSLSTKKDLIKFYPDLKNQVVSIPEAADREVFNRIYDERTIDTALEKYGLASKRFAFSLATLEPRKNLRNTIKAFVHFKEANPNSDLYLAMGGKSGWKEKLGVQDREDIIHLGYVSEADLPMLYNAAEFFIYCSHYEGFGLPLLESMRCGTPVIYGDNSSMSEIVSEAGIGVNSNEIQDISQAIETMALITEKRQDLADKAIERAQEYSWIRTARETWDLYRMIDSKAKVDGI